jgi:hypothetical protein
MTAITTKCLEHTTHLGVRIRAECASGSILVEWNYDLTSEKNHEAAARALLAKLGWGTESKMHCGTLSDGRRCYVLGRKNRNG